MSYAKSEKKKQENGLTTAASVAVNSFGSSSYWRDKYEESDYVYAFKRAATEAQQAEIAKIFDEEMALFFKLDPKKLNPAEYDATEAQRQILFIKSMEVVAETLLSAYPEAEQSILQDFNRTAVRDDADPAALAKVYDDADAPVLARIARKAVSTGPGV